MMEDQSWIYNQSGVIPFRYEQNEIKILLITSRNRRRWIIPKGIVELDMSPIESAANEAYEEAGVKGKIYPKPVGKFRYQKWGGTVTVQVYLLEVTEILADWPESFFRERRWLNIEEAEKLIDRKALKQLIHHLPAHINRFNKAK